MCLGGFDELSPAGAREDQLCLERLLAHLLRTKADWLGPRFGKSLEDSIPVRHEFLQTREAPPELFGALDVAVRREVRDDPHPFLKRVHLQDATVLSEVKDKSGELNQL